MQTQNLIKINDFIWEIPKSFRQDMRVPARIFASKTLLDEIFRDRSLEQLVNVATLPGIQKYALVMPDAHEGYGFPIGGIAATIFPDGVISPGGIGYDINCGVRLLKSEVTADVITPHLETLGQRLYQEVPSGVGRSGKIKLDNKNLNSLLQKGVQWSLEQGFAQENDQKFIESEGNLDNADSEKISQHAKERGRDQLGTMGAGNHFVEIDIVSEIFDQKVASDLGLFQNQIVVLIHCGSRGLGHQVATDYIRIMLNSILKYKITLPDRELACAPFNSIEGVDYFDAMSAAANFAWANRQLITWEIRKVWKEVLGEASGKLSILYDVAHNIAKVEEHKINGKPTKVIVHRKGATRSFPGQPVIIPGSMGTASYVLSGTEQAMRLTFGSSCHGAGRRMSRHQAKKEIQGKKLKLELEGMGIVIQAGSIPGLSEEAPLAYKDIHDVVDVVDKVGMAKKVVRLKPAMVIKG